jgi:hypothetical protein
VLPVRICSGFFSGKIDQYAAFELTSCDQQWTRKQRCKMPLDDGVKQGLWWRSTYSWERHGARTLSSRQRPRAGLLAARHQSAGAACKRSDLGWNGSRRTRWFVLGSLDCNSERSTGAAREHDFSSAMNDPARRATGGAAVAAATARTLATNKIDSFDEGVNETGPDLPRQRRRTFFGNQDW